MLHLLPVDPDSVKTVGFEEWEESELYDFLSKPFEDYYIINVHFQGKKGSFLMILIHNYNR